MGEDRTSIADAAAVSAESGWHPKGFGRLIDRMYPGIYRYLYALTGTREDAEDLTQEAFLRMWRHPPRPRARKAPKAWVYKVALNVWRKRARRAATERGALDGLLPGPGPEIPEDAALRQELSQRVQDAVGRLPDIYREVVVLHSLRELGLREVAEVLEICVGTVKWRLATAYRMLRKSLYALDGEPDAV